MKKYITFNTILAGLGFITLMLFFVPCIAAARRDGDATAIYNLNLFNITFGATINDPAAGIIKSAAVPTLIVSFVFVILAILLNFASNKFKLLNFLAGGFYVASGTITLLALPLFTGFNIGSYVPQPFATYYNIGGIYAVGVLLVIWGAFSLIASVISIAKPVPQETY